MTDEDARVSAEDWRSKARVRAGIAVPGPA